MTLEDISFKVGIPVQTLTYLEKIRGKLYTDFYVQKHNGKKREINMYLCDSKDQADEKLVEYSKLLKTVHRKLKDLLDEIPLPEMVFGFRKNETIKTCALKHVGKRYLISLDIQDFFPSTRSDQVLNALKAEGWDEMGAWLVARLVAHKGRLPQGAITSPVASNIAFKKYDLALSEYCQKHGFVYTRYADDITLSTDQDISNEIDQIVSEVESIIAPYKINRAKTKVYEPGEPHYVLGMIVNRKVNVPKPQRRLVRAMVHNFVHKHVIPYGVEDLSKYKRQLMGKLGYCLYVNRIPSLERLYEELKKFDPNKIKDWKKEYFEVNQ